MFRRAFRRVFNRTHFSSTAGARGFSVFSIPKRYPFAFACCFTSFKTFSADIFVQTVLEGKDPRKIEWKRTTVFALFGFCYQGAFQYVVYARLVAGYLLPNAGKYAALPLGQKLKDIKGAMQLLAQVGIANLILDPFFCLPSYYITKEAILGDREDGKGFDSLVSKALATYRSNFKDDLVASWKIWIPAQLINFGFMPIYLRVPFISVVSFGYCIVLSVMRGGDKTADATQLEKSLPHELDPLLLQTEIKRIIRDQGDGHGNLQRQGFVSLFERLNVNDEKALSRLYECFDMDKDGSVSPEEFATVILAISGGGSPADRASAIFQVCDLNGDGVITKSELVTIFQAVLRIEDFLLVHNEMMGLLPALAAKPPTNHTPNNGLLEQATKLAEAVMSELKHEQDKVIAPEEFHMWAESESPAAKDVMRLFKAFSPTGTAITNDSP